MRFFHSRVSQTAIVKHGFAYFVSSEQREHDTPRKYTIRKANLETGNIDTVGEFHHYNTSIEAKKALQEILSKK